MAKLTKCSVCGKDVSTSAKSCPNCGQRLKAGFFKKFFLGVGVVFGLLIIVGLLNPQTDQKPARVASAAQTEAPVVERGAEMQLAVRIARSAQQQSFDAAVAAGQQAEMTADNDMQKGAVLAKRGREICSLLPPNKAVENWQGVVKQVTANSDGKGVLVIEPADGVTIGTWNNALSDIMHDTLMDPSSKVFSQAAGLTKGQEIRFSGEFFTDADHCIVSSNLTLRGKLTSPDFIFKFAEIVSD